MKRFIDNLRRYYKYAIYSARADLKAEVAGSYLNWLWWILDPLCFMLIYMFIASVVFKSSEPNFPVFVFIALMCWDYFNRTITSAVKIVRNNRGIVTKIYIPKYILLLQKQFEYIFKQAISFCLVILFMIIFGMSFPITLLYMIPLLITYYMLTFGLGCILLHFGIFVEDLTNITALLLRLVFYLSGIFFNIATRVPSPYNLIMLNFNPVAFFIDASRNAIMYGNSPDFLGLAFWFFVGLAVVMFGVNLIQKYENSYAKVI